MASRNEMTHSRKFSLLPTWSERKPTDVGDALLEATIARLQIDVGDSIVTQFRSDKGDTGDAVEIPAYHLAEWIAENWWALLYEPLKSDEDEASHQFVRRHWVGSARNGFALPDLMLVPNDDCIEITARSAYLKHSRLTFEQDAHITLLTEEVARELRRFVSETVRRLRDQKIERSYLHNAWQLIEETDQDSEEFCRLMGSLGLSPYASNNEEIENVLSDLDKKFDTEALRDLCEAATPQSFERLAKAAESFIERLGGAPEVQLSRIDEVECEDDLRHAAWHWGVNAARKVRESFGILHADREGATKIFESLDVDSEANNVPRYEGGSNAVLTGALERSHQAMRLAILDDKVAQKRFTFARAAFLGWQTKGETARLVTTAKTRDQQASRAFAAEVLAPISFVKSRARGRYLSQTGIAEIARECQVSPWVITYQATNNGIRVG
jgi:hypothetical protein